MTETESGESNLNLNFGMQFAQLYNREGLLALDFGFLQELEAVAPDLSVQMAASGTDVSLLPWRPVLQL